MLIIRHHEVQDILRGRETDIIELISATYRLHDEGKSSLPHSTFLRFPDAPADRIIGLPAYLGGEKPTAGMKWIASFPGNIAAGVDRASAVVVLNSLANGRPEALVEASLISAKRTAASAALGAGLLLPDAGADTTGVTLVGCGVINTEILRFLKARLPFLTEALVYDQDPARAAGFARRAMEAIPGVSVTVADDLPSALAAHALVSLATTAAAPHLAADAFRDDATVLHVSLRDIHPETILASQNVVDDADHVCRERTSLDLAQKLTGNRDFVDASIGTLAAGTSSFQRDPGRPVVFSPFGLGILDLAVARFVQEEGTRQGLGVAVDDFLSVPATVPVPA
ncbi:2,3-diaminopropionate biosynthesis protein SbnB [Streptacidiphilus sp. EB129]|uniref:2,3-diaminopropionate biosynthesis protein SbnB n=1 Tax=Streptacidiphilus sp. EB129 TaxID=3156262 RepID=UPI003513BE7E